MKRMLAKAEFNYWVDIILLLAFLVVAVTSVVKFFFFLNGQTLGLLVRTFNQVHDWSGIVMVLAAAAHILLHLKRLIVMTKRRFWSKN